MENKEMIPTYIIRHPGTMEWILCSSFEEAESKWFEGFNLPFKISVEGTNDAYARMRSYYRVREVKL